MIKLVEVGWLQAYTIHHQRIILRGLRLEIQIFYFPGWIYCYLHHSLIILRPPLLAYAWILVAIYYLPILLLAGPLYSQSSTSVMQMPDHTTSKSQIPKEFK